MSFLYGTKVRLALATLGVVGAICAPPLVPLLCMVLLSLRFRAWEVPFLGLLIDFLWLPSGPLFSAIPLFTLAGLILVWGLEPLRNEFLAA